MNDYLALVLSVFIIYRFALMVSTEDGPFDIFLKWRALTASAWGVDHWTTRGFFCPLCVGFWISFIAPIYFADTVSEWAVYSLAIAGAQTFLTLIGGIPDE